MKPNIVPAVLNQISPMISQDNLIVSLAAGVPLGVMEEVINTYVYAPSNVKPKVEGRGGHHMLIF